MGFRRGEKKNGNRNFLLPSSSVGRGIDKSNRIESDLMAVANLASILKGRKSPKN